MAAAFTVTRITLSTGLGGQGSPSLEHAVLVFLKLADDTFGTPDERMAAYDLEDRLESAINQSGAGEYDGHDFGRGFAILYMYGPDADSLLAVVLPIVQTFPVRSGSYIVKQYGPPGSREERVALDPAPESQQLASQSQ